MNSMAAFITGINGQDGSYLAELLLEKGYYVHGILRRMSLMNTKRLDHINNPRFTYSYGDVLDFKSVYTNLELLLKQHPGKRIEIYHLAAQSHVQVSFEMPEYTTEVNATGTLKVLEAGRLLRDTYNLSKDMLRIYVACTSELYGKVLERPQSEKTPFNPQSPYGIAKQYAYFISKNYRESYDMYISNGILFNHESPRRGFNFVTRKITLGIGKIMRGETESISLGNIDAVRDWGHAKDYVKAMQMILDYEVPDDFVIATNETHTVREFVEKAFRIVDIQITWQGKVGLDQNGVIRIHIDPKYFRPAEVDYLHGDASKAFRAIGWKPDTSFDELVHEMVMNDISKS